MDIEEQFLGIYYPLPCDDITIQIIPDSKYNPHTAWDIIIVAC